MHRSQCFISFNLLLLATIFFECEGNLLGKQQILSPRTKKSIKDSYLKDDYTRLKIIPQMQHEIGSLERSMKNTYQDLSKVLDKNYELEISAAEENEKMLQLDSQITALQSTLAGRQNAIDNLRELVNPQDLYVLSNNTCGGNLVAQSGSILFNTKQFSTKDAIPPSSCVWTIRANNRKFIKVKSAIISHFSSNTSWGSILDSRLDTRNACIVEFVRNNTQDGFTVKKTRLQKDMSLVFAGPVIFVVFPYDQYSSAINFYIHFEGLGKLESASTLFAHKIVNSESSKFSNNDLEAWGSSAPERVSENSEYSFDYTTLVSSNIAKINFHVTFEKEQCADEDLFIVVSDLFEDSSSIDCCKSNCESALFTSYSPFLILITKKFNQQFKFNMSWVEETSYFPSVMQNSTSLQRNSTCGGILGGGSGTLIFQTEGHKRCAWVIAPQLLSTPYIRIWVALNTVKQNTHQHLYMVQLRDEKGNDLNNAPKITEISTGRFQVQSTEIYIIYYSDLNTENRNNFYLSWEAFSSIAVNNPGRDTIREFNILNHNIGSISSISGGVAFPTNFYRVFILTPEVPNSFQAYIGSLMHLTLNQTDPIVDGDNECFNTFQLYSAVYGELTKHSLNCYEPGRILLEHANGIAIIVIKSSISTPDSTVNFAWRVENTKITKIVNDNKCGGIISGDNGILRYESNPRNTIYRIHWEYCIWLVHSVNASNIKLDLVKASLSKLAVNQLFISTIETTNGTLRKNSVPISKLHRSVTLNESMVVILFQSNPTLSVGMKGFVLRFTANGQAESPVALTLEHRNVPSGIIEFSSFNLNNNDNKQRIQVVASSLTGIIQRGNPFITNIFWNWGLFRKDDVSCNYDSITFYTPMSYNLKIWNETRLPSKNVTMRCPSQIQISTKDNIVRSTASAFLVIYMPLGMEMEEERDYSFKYGQI